MTIRLSSATKEDLQSAADEDKHRRTASWLAVDIIEQWLAARRRRRRK